jgi:hypothetical protein
VPWKNIVADLVTFDPSVFFLRYLFIDQDSFSIGQVKGSKIKLTDRFSQKCGSSQNLSSCDVKLTDPFSAQSVVIAGVIRSIKGIRFANYMAGRVTGFSG